VDEPYGPRLPEGVDDQEYRRIRGLMRASVLNVWRGRHQVIAGLDPWDVVDEAWGAMAENGFSSKGPFLPHAVVVARNKAVDVMRRVEARRGDRSIDARRRADLEAGGPEGLHETIAGSGGADVDYFRGLDEVAAIQRLALAEEAIYTADVLTSVEREVFIAVRVDGKSRAAVGRQLVPPLTGQRVGQIVAQAVIKVQRYVTEREQPTTSAKAKTRTSAKTSAKTRRSG
jgi:DNA-directed RNA polymerase specialized sigma24 family protein